MKRGNEKNVLLIHTDQLRYDCVGFNGNQYALTPNLDKLAAAGTIFSRHISANPACMPSRASLMTGLYPPGHNVWANGVALNRQEYIKANYESRDTKGVLVPEPLTLADMFNKAGYHTASFGKLHLTPNLSPVSSGYPECWQLWADGKLDNWHGPYYGFQYVELTKGHGEGPCHHGHYALWLQKEYPDIYERIKRNQEDCETVVESLNDLYPSPVPAELHHSNWLADRTCYYLEKQSEKGEPFFAFVGFPDPHHPFTPPFDLVEQFNEIPVKDPNDIEGHGIKNFPFDTVKPGQDISKLSLADKRTIIRYTYIMVYLLDQAVGKIIQKLKETNLWEDTIIIFTSDHGDFLGDHGLLRKGYVGSDSLLHLPFVIRAPGISLPAETDICMSNCDVMPTLASLTSLDVPEGLHGEDITEIIKTGEDSQGREHRALSFCANGTPETINYTIYDRSYRFTWYPHLEYCQLFDHRWNPEESKNLYKEKPAIIENFKEEIKERLLEYYNPFLGRTGWW